MCRLQLFHYGRSKKRKTGQRLRRISASEGKLCYLNSDFQQKSSHRSQREMPLNGREKKEDSKVKLEILLRGQQGERGYPKPSAQDDIILRREKRYRAGKPNRTGDPPRAGEPKEGERETLLMSSLLGGAGLVPILPLRTEREKRGARSGRGV